MYRSRRPSSNTWTTSIRAPPALLPQDWEAAQDVRLWDRFFDNYVRGPMQVIVLDRINRARGDMARERAALATAYRMIEVRMAKRQWIAGDAFSLADCAAAPALFHAVTVEPLPAEHPRQKPSPKKHSGKRAPLSNDR